MLSQLTLMAPRSGFLEGFVGEYSSPAVGKDGTVYVGGLPVRGGEPGLYAIH